jgi:hypothetical protein
MKPNADCAEDLAYVQWSIGAEGAAWVEWLWLMRNIRHWRRTPFAKKYIDALAHELRDQAARLAVGDFAGFNLNLPRQLLIIEQLRASQLATFVGKVRGGPKQRQDAKDKAEIRNLAAAYWREHRDAEVADVVKIPSIAPFTRYYRLRTVKDWIRDLKPGASPAVIP